MKQIAWYGSTIGLYFILEYIILTVVEPRIVWLPIYNKIIKLKKKLKYHESYRK